MILKQSTWYYFIRRVVDRSCGHLKRLWDNIVVVRVVLNVAAASSLHRLHIEIDIDSKRRCCNSRPSR